MYFTATAIQGPLLYIITTDIQSKIKPINQTVTQHLLWCCSQDQIMITRNMKESQQNQ